MTWSPTAVFVWGISGSIVVDVITMAQYFDNGNPFLVRYRQAGYYLIRALVAVVGGGLAVAYDIDKAILAMNIGAATPLIVQTLARGVVSLQIGAPASTPSVAPPGSVDPSPAPIIPDIKSD